MCPGIETAPRNARVPSTWGRTFLTPSQGPVFGLLRLGRAISVSHWSLRPNRVIYWCIPGCQRLSFDSRSLRYKEMCPRETDPIAQSEQCGMPRNLDYTPTATRVPHIFKIFSPPCIDVEAKIRHRRAATRTSLPPRPPPCTPSVCPVRPARPARLLAIPYFGRANPRVGAMRARHPSVVLSSPSKHLVLPVLPALLGDGRSVTFV